MEDLVAMNDRMAAGGGASSSTGHRVPGFFMKNCFPSSGWKCILVLKAGPCFKGYRPEGQWVEGEECSLWDYGW